MESYSLAWAFAATRTITDHWEKRQKKGFLITIGDEPNLTNYPKNVLDSVMTGAESSLTDIQLLELVQEKWEVYHILIKPIKNSTIYWTNLLEQNCIKVDNFEDIADTIAQIIIVESNVTGVPQTEIKSNKILDLIKQWK